jgi:hypothetical protein
MPVPAGKSLVFEPRLLPGLTQPRGFATLRSVAALRRHERVGVNVFGWPSRNESVVLTLNAKYVCLNERTNERTNEGGMEGWMECS